MLKFFSVLSVIFSVMLTNAQVYEGAEAHERLKGAEILRLNETTGKVQYALLTEVIQVKEEGVLAYIESIYKLKSPFGLKLLKKEKDDIGFEHFRYQQTYNNIPILGAVLIAHLKAGRLHSFNGEIFEIVNPLAKPVFSERECLNRALDSVGAKLYMWQLPEEEDIIKEIKQDENATWFPKGELMYCPKNLNFEHTEFYLTYRFTIHAGKPRTGENIYIHVLNGELIARENLLHSTDVPGKANTKYSGTKTIITDSTAPNNFRLRENTRGGGVYTFNMKKGVSYGAAVDFIDSNNIWNNINANKDEVATDAHWGAETTFDFYKSRHNRNSYNNNNARINSYVHYSNNYDNAFWDGLRMTYGDGNAFKPLTSLDVCGHEITHAVTSNSAGLIYSYESGQLNESFSDMFGNAIERYGKPTGYSWIIGEEITNDGLGLRNMSNPKLKGHPRCYKSTYWYSGSGDNGGVHLNSGVQNWWFYLVSEGGSGVNDVSNTFKVDSLGIGSAEKIAYRNLTVYLTPSSQYADSRFYSIRAAVDLFGNCSKEVISVTNAWYACNVGAKYDSGYVKADFIADTIICSKSKLVNFTNMSTNSSTAKWTFGNGSVSTTFNPTHTYSAYGTYTIKLVAGSCFKNKMDSMTKFAYIKIDSTFDICNAVLLPSGGSDSTHKCQTFVYDEGGLGNYKNLKTTFYRLSAPGADSIRIRFFDFDYENGYDSLYIYKGKFPGGSKIGGFTGNTLPFAGKNFSVSGNMITLRHVSDPALVGRGFKMSYTAFKKPVDVTAFSDTTICMGNSTLLYAKGTGGYKTDYLYQWKNIKYDDSIIVSPVIKTVYKLYLTDVCTKSKDSAEVTVNVNNPLDVTVSRDTSICIGQSILLKATANGGKNTSYRYSWNNGLGSTNSNSVSPSITTTYQVILSDGCTPKSDTAFVTITVKNPLSVKLSTDDSTICYLKTADLSASGSGGNPKYYKYTWNNGLGTGTNKSISLNATTWLKVTLTDECTVSPASDSILINVLPALTVDLGNDTNICTGNGIALLAKVRGGDVSGYNYLWSDGASSSATDTVYPVTKTTYILTLIDNCSDMAVDSITVDLLAALKLAGLRDTTVCAGKSVLLKTISTGGKKNSYSYTWNNGLGNMDSHVVTPNVTTGYKVILSDACSILNDTAYVIVTVKDALEVKLHTSDTLICFNKSSKLTVSGKGGDIDAYLFTWDNGLGTGAGKTISLINNTWVKVNLTDACTIEPAFDSVFIKVRNPLSVNLNNDSSICKGSGINLNSITGGGDVTAYSYIWDQGLGSASSHKVNPSLKTTYKLTLKDNCSDEVSDSITVDVLPGLKITGLKDTIICFGGAASFTPVPSGGIPSQYTYQWDNGLSSSKNQTVSPKTNTIFRLELKDNCTIPSEFIDVKVTVWPALKVGLTLSKQEICFGDSARVNVSLNGGIPSQYRWTLNSMPQSANTVSISPVVNTPYMIEFSDNCSIDSDTSFIMVVNPIPIVDFEADKTEVCTGIPVQFTNKSSGASTYEWTFNTIDKSTLISPFYAYKTSGIFPVSLSAKSAKGCENILTKSTFMNVFDMPKSDFSFTAVSVTYDHPLVAFINKSTNYKTFEWNFGDAMTETSVTDPTHMYGDTGSFRVTLITVNSIGCLDTFVAIITINDIYKLFIPTAITVNGDGLNDELRVGGRGVVSYRIRIFNRWGEMIFTGTEKDKAFNGKDNKDQSLPKGSYVLTAEIKDHEGKVHYIRQVLQIL